MLLIHNSSIPEVKIIERKVLKDERGAFSRLFCERELASVFNGKMIKQVNYSVNNKIGTIRGLHFQNYPSLECKIVTCIKGKVLDVAIDLRKESSTFLQYTQRELSAMNMESFLIPEGFAHGFQTLEEDSHLIYFHSEFYDPKNESSLNPNDPALGINWPLPVGEISEKDRSQKFITKDFQGIQLI